VQQQGGALNLSQLSCTVATAVDTSSPSAPNMFCITYTCEQRPGKALHLTSTATCGNTHREISLAELTQAAYIPSERVALLWGCLACSHGWGGSLPCGSTPARPGPAHMAGVRLQPPTPWPLCLPAATNSRGLSAQPLTRVVVVQPL
jgi:hypothetical protein